MPEYLRGLTTASTRTRARAARAGDAGPLDAMSHSRDCSLVHAPVHGAWEHSSGVLIESCGQPGGGSGQTFWARRLQVARSEKFQKGSTTTFRAWPVWLSCHVDGDTWHGAGDERNWKRILETFLTWAEQMGLTCAQRDP